jgi:hypothetical protein
MPTEYELNILKGNRGLLGLGSLDFDDERATLEFEDERKAVLFSLTMGGQYPLDGSKTVTELRECYSTLPNYFLYSLRRKRDLLRGRRLVYLVDTRPETRATAWRAITPDDYHFIPPDLAERLREQEYRERVEFEEYRWKTSVRNLLEDAKGRGYSPREVVICRTTFGEDFYGAVGAFALRSEGYLVFPEGTLSDLLKMWGTPDMVAVKLGPFQEELAEFSVVERGALLDEVELYGQCENRGAGSEPFLEEAVAVEVESSSSTASKGREQLGSYVSTGYFDYGLLVCPGRVGDERYYPDDGYISWGEDGGSKFYRPSAFERGNKVDETLERARALVAYVLMKHLSLNGLAEALDGESIVGALRSPPLAKILSLTNEPEK